MNQEHANIEVTHYIKQHEARGLSTAAARAKVRAEHPALWDRAFGVGAGRAPSLAEDGAYIVRMLVKQGRSRAAAEATLAKTHPQTFRAYTTTFTLPDAREVLAGKIRECVKTYGVRREIAAKVVVLQNSDLAKALLPDQGDTMQRESKKFAGLVGASSAKTYTPTGGGVQNPWHVVLAQLTREEVINLIAAEALSRSDAIEWVQATRPGIKNKQLELDVEAIILAVERKRVAATGKS